MTEKPEPAALAAAFPDVAASARDVRDCVHRWNDALERASVIINDAAIALDAAEKRGMATGITMRRGGYRNDSGRAEELLRVIAMHIERPDLEFRASI